MPAIRSSAWLARAALPACGRLLASEPFRDPDCRQLSRADLLPSRNASQAIERLRIERHGESLGRWPPQTHVNVLPLVEEPYPLLITELVPLTGLFTKGSSLPCC